MTRRLWGSILIGDQVSVISLDVKGSQVRIGIEAPREMRVLCKELLERDEPPEAA